MIFKSIREEIDSILARDPDARSRLEVVLCHPGFHQLRLHRLAHRVRPAGLPLPALPLPHLGKFFIGIDIDPGKRAAVTGGAR